MCLTALAPLRASANPFDDLVNADIRFDVPGTDLIPGVAAVRAACDVHASAESLAILAGGGSIGSTLAAAPGPCTIVLVLLGVDVALPVFNTTPLGRSSFYLPGISTVTLGLVDLSVDLVTSLNSTSRVAEGIANVTPNDITWGTWGAQRIAVVGEDGVGSVTVSALETVFRYTMSVALTVYAVSIQVYHADLARIGSFAGQPSLVAPLSVDLRPHALILGTPSDVGSDQASFTWNGTVDSDVDHLELRLTDGTSEVSYRLPPAATRADVLVRPSTHYEARLVSVDRAGQTATSNSVVFDSAAAPPPPSATPVEAMGSPVFTGTMVALAVLAGVVGYAWGFLRGRKGD